jgi:hypothetical protein
MADQGVLDAFHEVELDIAETRLGPKRGLGRHSSDPEGGRHRLPLLQVRPTAAPVEEEAAAPGEEAYITPEHSPRQWSDEASTPELLDTGGADVQGVCATALHVNAFDGPVMAPYFLEARFAFAVKMRLLKPHGLGLDIRGPLIVGAQEYIIVERIHLGGAIKAWNWTCDRCNNQLQTIYEGDALVVGELLTFEEQMATLKKAKRDESVVQLMVYRLQWQQPWHLPILLQ